MLNDAATEGGGDLYLAWMATGVEWAVPLGWWRPRDWLLGKA
jgi:hypothetical protein